jgi:hypothetical protein
MSGYDPVSIRVQPTLARLQRETQRGMGLPVPFATVCIGLNIPRTCIPASCDGSSVRAT